MRKLTAGLIAFVMVSSACVEVYAQSENERIINDVIMNSEYVSDYDTSVFEGHPTYILQDHFTSVNGKVFDPQAETGHRSSGWDIDYRGGWFIVRDGILHLVDGDDSEKVSMNRKLMTHRYGDLTFESAFTMDEHLTDGFYYSIYSETGEVLHLETSKDMLCYKKGEKLYPLKKCVPNKKCSIKAIIKMQKQIVEIWIDGKFVSNVPFYTASESITGIEISTGVEEVCSVKLPFVYLYINYLVNERFMATPIGKTPGDWELISEGNMPGSVKEKSGSPYCADNTSYEITDNSVLEKVELKKTFIPQDNKIRVEWRMLIPDKGDGVECSIASGNNDILFVSVKEKDILINNTEILYKDFLKNFWFYFQIDVNIRQKTCDIYINYKKIKEDVPFKTSVQSIDSVCFRTGYKERTSYWIDDVLVYKVLPDYKNYPTEPRKPKTKGYDVGMLMYSMWREGMHFGWDTSAAYDYERKPYLGYYAEGSTEVADWENKWLVEHGFDFMVYPVPRPSGDAPSPIKTINRGEALNDGYLNSRYSNQIDFCIMLSAVYSNTYFGIEDFKNNVLPYWVEYYFKDPRYKTINNKPLVYTYNIESIALVFGNGDIDKGIDALREMQNLIREAVKKIGYEDVIFVAEVSRGIRSPEIAKALDGAWEYWYGHNTDKADVVIADTEAGYNDPDRTIIASVPAGYECTPYRPGLIGFVSVDGIDKICSYITQKTEKLKSEGREEAGVMTFTCWNEYGEGHYFAPTTLAGFDYLNIARKHFTYEESFSLEQEAMPDEEAIARMDVLYPPGRGFLKILEDKVVIPTPEDLLSYDVLKKWDFSNKIDFSDWKIDSDISSLTNENGLLVAQADGVDPKIICDNIDLPASNVKYIIINGYAEGGTKFITFYQTTEDPTMGVNGKRYEGFLDPSKQGVQEVVQLPAIKSKLRGNITRIRIDPDDNLQGKFYIQSVELFGELENTVNYEDFTYSFDGVTVIAPTHPRVKDNTIMIPTFRLFEVNMGCYLTWEYSKKTMTLHKNGKKVVLIGGDANMYVDGSPKKMAQAPYYDKGCFFVPYEDIAKEMGYTANLNLQTQQIEYYSQAYLNLLEYKTENGKWEFNSDGYNENWTYSRVKVAKAFARDGALFVAPASNNPIITIKDLNFNAEDYNYAVIRMKTEAESNEMRLYFTTDTMTSFSGDTKIITLIKTNGKYNTYIIDLKSNANWKGKITQLRLDPVCSFDTVSIDYIRLVKTLN